VLYQNYRKIKALNDNIESNGKKLLEVKIYKFIPTLSQYLYIYNWNNCDYYTFYIYFF